MQLAHLLPALRRLWPVVVVLTVLGAAAGYLSTPQPETADGTRYYKATHSLILVDQGDGKPDGKIQQAAFLVGRGEVPERVAGKLGLETDQVTTGVMGEARPDLLSLQVTGVSTDPQEAVELADTSASELMTFLAEEASARQASQRDEVLTRLDGLEAQIDQLDLALVAGPNDQLQAERDSLINQYRLAYEELQTLASEGAPSSGFESIEPAAAVEISRSAYGDRKVAIAAGPQPITNRPADADEPTSEEVEAPPPPPSPVLPTAVGAVLGALLGLGAVFLLDRYDTRIRSKADAEEAFGVSVIAEIPSLSNDQREDERVLSFVEPRSRFAEAHRLVRTSVLFLASTRPEGAKDGAEVVLVTSPSPDDGKTTTVSNLAAVLAEAGQSVLVVNCDFRRPRIHRFLHSDGASVVQEAGNVQVVQTEIDGVRLVTSPPMAATTNPAEIIGLQRDVVAAARKHFDVILLDTAPILTTNDAAELLPITDLVLLVAQADKTRWDNAARTTELLQRLDAKVGGVVLTNSRSASSNEYYYYYYLNEGSERETTIGRRRKQRAKDGTDQRVDALS